MFLATVDGRVLLDSFERDVKKAAELKLWLEGRIAELQDEIERLKESLGYVDATLRASTFRPANEMMAETKEMPEVRELKRDKSNQVIARAAVTPDSVSIEPSEGITLKSTTPPFKSFLLGKILQGMNTADLDFISKGKLGKGMELKFDVEESNGSIGKLIVENYREKARLNEILNTVSWTFSRMLEK
jgi:uncharacterized small protein (DUF1192 family)